MKAVLSLCATLVSLDAFAQTKTPYTAAEMQALLAKGLSVASSDIGGGKSFTGRLNLDPSGKLTGSLTLAGHGAVPLNGSWRLHGGQLCRTLGQVQPELVCETWIRRRANEAIVQVNGQDVSINRW